MSKELKALEEMRYLVVFDDRLVDDEGEQEPIKVFVDEVCEKQYKIVKKALEALEIIAKKNRTIRFVFACGDYDGYVKGCKFNHIEDKYLYTKEEYDLIKEVVELCD